jgi:hypothetical protein
MSFRAALDRLEPLKVFSRASVADSQMETTEPALIDILLITRRDSGQEVTHGQPKNKYQ